MNGVNKIILIGRAGNNAELKSMINGQLVTSISLATSESWKDKDTGEKRTITQWHRVIFYRKLAEIAGTYIKKGLLIYVEGSMKYRTYQDSNGIEKSISEVIANEFEILTPKSEEGELTEHETLALKPPSSLTKMAFEDDIPF